VSGKDIYFDRRAPSGSFWIDKLMHAATLNVEQDYPSIDVDPSGNLYVVWSDGRNQTSVGGPNPDNTWEIFFTWSKNGGASWAPEVKASMDSPGYNNFIDLNPRIEVNPWGNPYVAFTWHRTDIMVSRSCDGGSTWEAPVTAYTVPTDCFFFYAPNFALRPDGTAFIAYVDTRVNPGPDHPYMNLFLTRSE
jgi:hypothetical protein